MTFHGGQPLDGVRTGYSQIASPFAGISHAFNKSGVTWINPNSFVIPASGIGNLRRNQIYGRASPMLICLFFKDIPITERLRRSSELRCSTSSTASTSLRA